MSDPPASIHEFDVSLICAYFAALERQGPGSPAATVQALDFVDNLSAASRIADIGCGTGGQTMVLGPRTPRRGSPASTCSRTSSTASTPTAAPTGCTTG